LNTSLRRALTLVLLILPAGALGAAVDVTRETLTLTAEGITSPARPGELATLDVAVTYRSAMTQEDYPDFIALEQDLRRWIAAAQPAAATAADTAVRRPWAALLDEAASRALADYEPIEAIRLTVRPHPSAARPAPGEVLLTATREAPAQAAQRILIHRHGLEHQGPNVIDLLTTVHYRPGADVAEAPEGNALRQALIAMMADYPRETDYWETLIKALGTAVLDRHALFESVELTLKVYPTASLTYPHEVSARLERAAESPASAGEPAAAARSVPEVIQLADQRWYEAEDRAVARELVSPRNSSTESLSIAEIVVPAGVTVRPHRHHMEEVYHVLAGEGVVMVEDRTQTEGPGDTVLIPPHAWHNIVNADDAELRLHVTCVPAWAPEHLIFERAPD